MIKKLILGISVVAALWGCDSKERAKLQTEVDSLRVELQVSQQLTENMEEIGILLDSIDANRQLLRTDMVEGTSYENYTSRLRDINGYIQETQDKISQLEKSAEKSKSSYAATIKKLKLDLESRSLQIAALEQEVSNLHGENAVLSKNVNERDSMITQHTGTIKLREQDIASLEAHVQEISDKAKMDQADLYFAQAQALETAAVRTKFAPRKKKETKREALELYKLSLSLGKEEAQAKINQLEKDLS